MGCIGDIDSQWWKVYDTRSVSPTLFSATTSYWGYSPLILTRIKVNEYQKQNRPVLPGMQKGNDT